MYYHKTNLTLAEIEEIIKSDLDNVGKSVRKISELGLSYAEYQRLLKEVKNVLIHAKDIKIFEEYSLCITTAFVYSFYYETEQTAIMNWIKDCFTALPQHQFRSCINLIRSVLEDYGMCKSQKNYCSLLDLCNIIMEQSAGTNSQRQPVYAN